MKLNNKTCLITGGTRGIGAATAISVAREGADVAIVGRNADDEAISVKEKVEGLGQRCELIRKDLSTPEAGINCVKETVEKLGGIDVLVHSAGGAVPGDILTCKPEDWMDSMNVHVNSTFFLCQAAAPYLIEKKEGAIVLISSVAAIRGLKGGIAYGTAKAAVIQLTRMVAYQLADYNIRVNCVVPGVIRTAFHDSMPEEVKQHNIANRIPLHKEGTAQDVANAILELMKNEYMTGSELVIDGGLTSRTV
jgi:NAD(P)-dependent dehydrogenase (short-subunit alcohol dehydrogenase family)